MTDDNKILREQLAAERRRADKAEAERDAMRERFKRDGEIDKAIADFNGDATLLRGVAQELIEAGTVSGPYGAVSLLREDPRYAAAFGRKVKAEDDKPAAKIDDDDDNPWITDNITRQVQMVRDDPAKAARLQKAAGKSAKANVAQPLPAPVHGASTNRAAWDSRFR